MNVNYEEMLRRGELQTLSGLEDKSFEAVMAKATALSRLGKSEEALQAVLSAEPANPREVLESLLLSADIHRTAGMHSEMIETVTGFDAPAEAGYDAVSRLHLLRGELHQMFGDDVKAIEEFAKAYNLAKKVENTDTSLQSLEGAVLVTRSLGLVTEVEKTSAKALQAAKECLHKSCKPLTHIRAAEIIAFQADIEDAEPLFESAIRESAEGGYKWDEAQGRLATGRFYEYYGDDRKAMEFTTQSLKLFGAIGAIPSAIIATEQLATQLANAGRHDEAIDAFDTVIESSRKLKDVTMLLHSLVQAANLCFELTEYAKGLDYLVLIIKEAIDRDSKPPTIIEMMREAFRKVPRELLAEKLGDYVDFLKIDEEDEYKL